MCESIGHRPLWGRCPKEEEEEEEEEEEKRRKRRRKKRRQEDRKEKKKNKKKKNKKERKRKRTKEEKRRRGIGKRSNQAEGVGGLSAICFDDLLPSLGAGKEQRKNQGFISVREKKNI